MDMKWYLFSAFVIKQIVIYLLQFQLKINYNSSVSLLKGTFGGTCQSLPFTDSAVYLLLSSLK